VRGAGFEPANPYETGS